MNNTTQSLKEKIYHKILNNIVSGEYPPHQFLKENSLAEEFGVSRILIREALIELQKDDIVKSIPRAGYQILQLTGKEIQDAIRTRSILEAGAAGYALRMINQDKIDQLERIVVETETALKSRSLSLSEWWDGNIRFHTIITEATGNSLLINLVNKTTSIIWRACLQYFSGRDPNTYYEFYPEAHKMILEALRRKDEAEFIKLIQADSASMSSLFRID